MKRSEIESSLLLLQQELEELEGKIAKFPDWIASAANEEKAMLESEYAHGQEHQLGLRAKIDQLKGQLKESPMELDKADVTVSDDRVPDPGGVDSDARESTERYLLLWGKLRPVDDLAIVALVFIAGGLGGLCAHTIGIRVPLTTTPEGKALDYLNCWQMMFAGLVAAGLTVFYVARTDTRNVIRTFFFAVICGLSGPSLIRNSMSQSGNGSELGARAEADRQKANQLEKEGKTDSETNINKHTEDLLSVATSSLKTVEKADSQGEAKTEVKAENTVNDVTSSLASFANQVATNKPEAIAAPVSALTKILEKAEASGNKTVAATASNALEKLPPRVYLEVAERLTSAELNGFRAKAKLSFKSIVPSQDVIEDLDYNEARVQYYREDDKAEADEIVQKLKDWLPEDLKEKARSQMGKAASPRPRHYDMRLGKNILQAIKPALIGGQ